MKFVLLGVAIWALQLSTVWGQLSIPAGQYWAYEFTTLPFSHVESTESTPDPYYPSTTAGFVTVTYSGGNGTSLKWAEISGFEDATTSEQNRAGTIVYGDMQSPTSFGAGGLWQDLEGIVRVSVFQNPFTLESVHVRVHRPVDAKNYNVYEQTFLVPEPCSNALFAIGCGLILLGRRFAVRTSSGIRGQMA